MSSTNKGRRVLLKVEDTKPIYSSIEQWAKMGSKTDKFQGISRNFCSFDHTKQLICTIKSLNLFFSDCGDFWKFYTDNRMDRRQTDGLINR